VYGVICVFRKTNSCSDHRSRGLDGGPVRRLFSVRVRLVEQETYHSGGQDQLQPVRETQRRTPSYIEE